MTKTYGHTLEEAIKIAMKREHVAILEKDGMYLSEKNWDEVKYAISLGWNYVGHPVDLVNNK